MRSVVNVAMLLAALVSIGWSQEQPQEAVVVLDGVIVAENPADSIALIRRAGARRARPLRIGQEYGGYVLVEVDRDAVVLRGDTGLVQLTFTGVQARADVGDAPETEAPTRETGATWVRRSFSRAEASERLEKEMPVILSDTQLTPRVVEGEIRGLELLRLPDGTMLSQAGLLPGDVLRSINEEPLRGLDSLWELLARFAEKDELRLIVERRGEVVRFAYDFTN